MTRYTAVDPASAYQNNRRFPLSASRQTARAHPVGAHIIGLQSDSENPADKGRKRIAVACSRCRKRKIKCSGDPKNGQGCQNCRNAGSDPSQCQFLRVSSSSIECVEWPYLMSNGPQFTGASAMGIYGIGSQNVSAPIPTAIVPQRRVQQSWPYVYPPLHSPGDYYNYDMSTQEAVYDPPYPFHQASGFPASDHRTGQQAFHSQELLRQWPNLPKVERMQLNALNNTPPATFVSSGMPYQASLAPMSAVDPSVCFPSMGALAKSLPRSGQNGGRGHPTSRPETSRTEGESNIVTAGPSYGVFQSANHSVAVPWYQERAALEPQDPSSDLKPVNPPGPVSYASGAKTLSSSVREPVISGDRVSMVGISSVPSRSVAMSSTFGFSSTSAISNIVDESLAFDGTSQGAHEPLRGRVPSTGSLSHSTASGSPKRSSVSSNGTDSTLLNGATQQSATQLRHIQPAQKQTGTKTTNVRLLQRERKFMK